jgi:hypothetical protein
MGILALRRVDTPRLIFFRYRIGERHERFDALSRQETIRFEPFPVFDRDQLEAEILRRLGSEKLLAAEEKGRGRSSPGKPIFPSGRTRKSSVERHLSLCGINGE